MVAVPVVQPALEQEVLAREAQVVGCRAGDGIHLAERTIGGVPHLRPGAVRHLARTIEMIGVHVVEVRRCGVDVGHHGQRRVVDPDVLAQRRAGVVGLGNEPPVRIVDVVRRAGRRHVLGGADRHPLQAVVGVVGGDRCSSLYPAGPKYPSGQFICELTFEERSLELSASKVTRRPKQIRKEH